MFTLPDRQQYVPYRTSYYERSWGICMTHEQFEGLPEGVSVGQAVIGPKAGSVDLLFKAAGDAPIRSTSTSRTPCGRSAAVN